MRGFHPFVLILILGLLVFFGIGCPEERQRKRRFRRTPSYCERRCGKGNVKLEEQHFFKHRCECFSPSPAEEQ